MFDIRTLFTILIIQNNSYSVLAADSITTTCLNLIPDIIIIIIIMGYIIFEEKKI
jgi:hypothetical protein